MVLPQSEGLCLLGNYGVPDPHLCLGVKGINICLIMHQVYFTLSEMSEFVDDEGVRWVCERKRPNIALLNHYQVTWKPKNNHFLRYTDVKPKGE